MTFSIDRSQGYPNVVLHPLRQAFFQLIDFETFSPQDLIFKAADHFRFVSHVSGARFGKSVEGGTEAAYKSLLVPGHQTWLVGENYEAAKKEFEYAYEIFTVDLPKAIPGFFPKQAAFNRNNPADWFIELRNGSWIKPKTAENLNSLLSEELDLIVLCEGSNLPLAAWERRLAQRIVTRFGQIFIPSTAAGFTWTHDEFFLPSRADWAPQHLGYKPIAGYTHTERSNWYLRNTPAERERWSRSYFSAITPACDSPYYPREEFDRLVARAERTGDWHSFYEQVIGLFVQKTGLVIKNFDKGLITCAELTSRFGWGPNGEPPADWDRTVWMDYGETAPKATLLGAIHPRYACVVWYDGYYETGDDIEEQVRWAVERIPDGLLRAKRRVSFGVDRSAPIREYNKALGKLAPGHGVLKSRNTAGRKEQMETLTDRLLRDGRCFVVQDSVNEHGRVRTEKLQWEAARLVRKPQSDRPYADDVDRRVEKDDHACDCLFYGNEYLGNSLEGSFETAAQDDPFRWGPDSPNPTFAQLRDEMQPKPDVNRFVDYVVGRLPRGERPW